MACAASMGTWGPCGGSDLWAWPVFFGYLFAELMARRLHVVLVAPEIHWNTGNVGRTCLAVNAELHLVEPLGFSLADKHLRRAGLDYWPRVRVTVWRDWADLAAELPGFGTPFFFSSRARRDYDEIDYPDDTVLVFGRESVGLPEEILAQHEGALLRIPMADPALRSLNLSTAVAIGAYEVRRQWMRRP
jgi:tRNA (cytidine/uridine-2'-O-)-methyltransferase